MQLRKRINSINKDQIRAGQVLEIDYPGDGRRMIFVIDPKTAPSANPQTRKNMVFAFKLKNLSEKDTFDLIMQTRGVANTGKMTMYDFLKASNYVDGSRSLRTYDPNKISRVWRVTLGHPRDVPTKRIYIGNSVLYGCAHGSYVFVHERDWDTLENEINSKKATYYEGTTGHEKPVQELLQYLVGKTGYTSDTWENVNAKEDPVLPLFGGDTETIIEQIRGIVKERKLKYSGKVVDILASTSGYIPNGNTWWGSDKLSAREIKNIAKLGEPYLNTSPLDKIVNSREEFEKIYEEFHANAQKYAFAKDQRKPKPEVGWKGEATPRTELEIRARNANLVRDVYLVKLMKEKPGVYFAGEGHVDLVRLVYRAQQKGIDLSKFGG
jgi:hypothetical protein